MSNPNIMYWNCGSGIIKKLDTIRWHLSNDQPDIFFVAEADILKDLPIPRLCFPSVNHFTAEK